MAVNLTKPSLRIHEFTPVHITDETPSPQAMLHEIEDPPEVIAKIANMPLSIKVMPANKNTPAVISKTYNCKIPRKFMRAVRRTERRMADFMNDGIMIVRAVAFNAAVITLIAGVWCLVSPVCPKGLGATLSTLGLVGLFLYILFDKVLNIGERKPKSKLQFFRFEGTFDELKAYLAQNYPKCELVPATTVLRYPKGHECDSKIEQQYMQSTHRFLVAVDNVEFAYADAAAPYEDDLTAFYNTHQD